MTTEEKSKIEVCASLQEVWDMKDAAQKELEGKTWEEQKQILHQSMIDAAKSIGATLVKLPNGNYKFA